MSKLLFLPCVSFTKNTDKLDQVSSFKTKHERLSRYNKSLEDGWSHINARKGSGITQFHHSIRMKNERVLFVALFPVRFQWYNLKNPI